MKKAHEIFKILGWYPIYNEKDILLGTTFETTGYVTHDNPYYLFAAQSGVLKKAWTYLTSEGDSLKRYMRVRNVSDENSFRKYPIDNESDAEIQAILKAEYYLDSCEQKNLLVAYIQRIVNERESVPLYEFETSNCDVAFMVSSDGVHCRDSDYHETAEIPLADLEIGDLVEILTQIQK